MVTPIKRPQVFMGKGQPITPEKADPSKVLDKKPIEPRLPPGTAMRAPPTRVQADERGGASASAQQSPMVAEVSRDPPIADSSKALDPAYVRLDLPSRFLPYSFKSLSIRRFRVSDLMKINRAVQSNSLTIMLDALGATIDQDIRALTVPDYRYLMFWQRLESYPQSPYTITWYSKYGNECKAQVRQTLLEEKRLEMSEEEYAEWNDKGLRIPTMREAEILDIANLDVESHWGYTRAQYLRPELYAQMNLPNDPFKVKAALATLDNMGIEILENIRDFATKIEHGVVESIKAKDDQFNAEDRIETLRGLIKSIETLSGNEVAPAVLQDMLTELNDLESKKEAGVSIVAEEQTIPLQFDAWNFFPGI